MTAQLEEPEITINGVLLTAGQAMLVRVAVAMFSPYCGADEIGLAMTRGYNERRNEVLELLMRREAAHGPA